MPLPEHARKKPPPAARRVQEAMAQPAMREEMPQAQEQELRLSVSDKEILQKKDFAQMSAAEIAQVLRAIVKMKLPQAELVTRRYQPDSRGLRLDMRRTIRRSLRTSGETVIIDGLCASACTIVLGAVPHDRICVTSAANLGFHAAWDFGANGRAVTNAEATQMLYSMYPTVVKKWIAQRGGLTPRMIFLRGKQLQAMYKPCYLDAQASANRPAASR